MEEGKAPQILVEWKAPHYYLQILVSYWRPVIILTYKELSEPHKSMSHGSKSRFSYSKKKNPYLLFLFNFLVECGLLIIIMKTLDKKVNKPWLDFSCIIS